jgi:hypothetical protein
MTIAYTLPAEMTRCKGRDCTETSSCLRYVTIGRDAVDLHFSTIETGMHKESGCIFKIEILEIKKSECC